MGKMHRDARIREPSDFAGVIGGLGRAHHRQLAEDFPHDRPQPEAVAREAEAVERDRCGAARPDHLNMIGGIALDAGPYPDDLHDASARRGTLAASM